MAAPRKEDVKNMILKSAESLIGQKGISDVSLSEIARATGISKGTLYYHYKSKDEIMFDITDSYLDRQWKDLIEWTENKDKDTSIHRLIKYVIERNVATAGLRLYLFYDAATGNETMRAKLTKRYEEFEKLISEKIAQRSSAADADFITWLILLASDGLYIQKMLKNETLDIAHFIAQTDAYVKQYF